MVCYGLERSRELFPLLSSYASMLNEFLSTILALSRTIYLRAELCLWQTPSSGNHLEFDLIEQHSHSHSHTYESHKLCSVYAYF